MTISTDKYSMLCLSRNGCNTTAVLVNKTLPTKHEQLLLEVNSRFNRYTTFSLFVCLLFVCLLFVLFVCLFVLFVP